jgi:hypothetical protein
MSDYAKTFAALPLNEVVAAMLSCSPRTGPVEM